MTTQPSSLARPGSDRSATRITQGTRSPRIPWTVNDKATIAAQIDSGVDGVITDYPDVMQ